MKVGDYIGGLFRNRTTDGKEEWILRESKITKIVQNSKGTKVYSKAFYPIELEEIEDNTEMTEEANGYIFTREVVLLTDSIRAKYERWVKLANESPDSVKSVFSEDNKEDTK